MLVHAELPEASSKASEPIDPQHIASVWVAKFNDLLEGQNVHVEDLFFKDSYWRDLLCSSWDFHTYQGVSRISSVLTQSNQQCRVRSLEIDASSDVKKPSVRPIDFNAKIEGVQVFLTVKTDIGHGRGLVRLVRDVTDGGRWKAFTLFTTMEELTGYEESTSTRRPTGVDHGAHLGRLNWQQRRDAEANCEPPFDPTVLVIGMS